MVPRGNVNTARITRYRSYEAMIGEGEEGGCYCVMINRWFFYTDTSSSQQNIDTSSPRSESFHPGPGRSEWSPWWRQGWWFHSLNGAGEARHQTNTATDGWRRDEEEEQEEAEEEREGSKSLTEKATFESALSQEMLLRTFTVPCDLRAKHTGNYYSAPNNIDLIVFQNHNVIFFRSCVCSGLVV